MPLEFWDVAKPPRRELTPRTGWESGIPARDTLPCPPQLLVGASSKYLRGEEVRRRALCPVSTMPMGLGVAVILPCCLWGR